MDKQTKNTITREEIAKELRRKNTVHIRSFLIWGGCWSLFSVPMTVGVVRQAFFRGDTTLPIIICGFILGAGFTSPIWVSLIMLWKLLAERALIRRGEFEISIRPLSYKSEGIRNRRLVEFLHFPGFKEIQVSHTTCQLASQDDEFYIIHYRAKESIEFVYPLKLYEYKEE